MPGERCAHRLHQALQAALAQARPHARAAFIDLFAGAGGLTREARRRGLPALAIDIARGKHCDIRSNEVFNTIRGWLGSGLVCALFSGTPCEGLSQARRAPAWSRMPRRLRSPDHPEGLPDLEGKDREALERSNDLARRAGLLLRLAVQLGIPSGEENPASSCLWQLTDRIKMAQDPNCTDYVVDYCSWGRPFRARTRIRLWHAVAKHLSDHRCTGKRLCAFSGRPHHQLTGASSGNNGFLTKLKNRYPDGLCCTLVAALFDALQKKKLHRRWDLLHPAPQAATTAQHATGVIPA